jgi:hypothetical protein
MLVSRRDVFRSLPGALTSPLLLSLADAQLTPEVVRFRPEIEPLVSLIEHTSREQCAAVVVDQLRRGVSYRQLLAALFLAGIRNVNPRPPGFALHCVFVIYAAHLISLEAPADSRLLPLFYALDDFKAAQERDAHAAAGDYTMQTVRGQLPSPERAAAELAASMEAWDFERAERAVVSLARNRSAGEIFSMLWRYGARDYRNIGHKAIFAANGYRTLQVIGWQHAEPVLRSLVLALLDFGKQQVNGYTFDDQCYAGNMKLVKDQFTRLNDAWASGQADAEATRGVLRAIRESGPNDACAEVAARLVKNKTSAASVWDAVHLASAELRMRARGGASLASIHSVTSANALHYAYLTAPDSQLRFLLMLQAVGWIGQFRTFAGSRPENLRQFSIIDLEPSADEPLDRALTETFAGVPAKPEAASARVMRLAPDLASRQAYLTAALRYTISKINEVHYYKYLAALMEDIPLVSPEWQPHMLATTTYYIKGSNDPEPPVMKRAREALRAL